jgi:hypothetical protein
MVPGGVSRSPKAGPETSYRGASHRPEAFEDSVAARTEDPSIPAATLLRWGTPRYSVQESRVVVPACMYTVRLSPRLLSVLWRTLVARYRALVGHFFQFFLYCVISDGSV